MKNTGKTSIMVHKPEKILIPHTCHERFINLAEQAAEPFREYGIINAGISTLHVPYEIINNESHSPFSIVFFTYDGSGYVETDDLQSAVEPGSVMIIPPGVYHRYLAKEQWRVCWFHIAGDSTLPFQSMKNTRVHPHPFSEHVYRAMEAYVALSDTAGEWHTAQARRYARLVCAYLTQELYPVAKQAVINRRQVLEEVWNRVNDALSYKWHTQELAALANMSPAHFHRRVQEHYQQAPMEIVTRLRIQRAKEYLINTGYPMKIICELVGYANPYSFSNAFMKVTGMRPRTFRRIVQE
jgi:AraC-like DNA-binding protein/mannose-6-phosphate isomerase-like protein (cupin superfamily)